ncbi:MAG: hypothetical protein JRN35_10155 [Nitrososphaerota archaeon]|nr:hypothetical protein [Nitrososphaerota archaeon]
MGDKLVGFLANFVIGLTVLIAKDPAVRNGKRPKNFLYNVTVEVVYRELGF